MTHRYSAGAPCWADLSSENLNAVKPFYASLFNWVYDAPDHEFGGHVIASVGDYSVAGLGSVPPGGVGAWTLYFYSLDAD